MVWNTHSFRLVGAFKTKKQPQKRVFREKLALDVFSGHKPTQTRLVQLHIVSCRNVQLTGANQHIKSTFLDGQTLKGPFATIVNILSGSTLHFSSKLELSNMNLKKKYEKNMYKSKIPRKTRF